MRLPISVSEYLSRPSLQICMAFSASLNVDSNRENIMRQRARKSDDATMKITNPLSNSRAGNTKEKDVSYSRSTKRSCMNNEIKQLYSQFPHNVVNMLNISRMYFCVMGPRFGVGCFRCDRREGLKTPLPLFFYILNFFLKYY